MVMTETTWADAVAQLSGMRTKAETSAAVIKKFGAAAHIARGQLIYSDAKSEADAVIAGLMVALSANGQPERLSSLLERTEQMVTVLAKLRNMAESQLPQFESTKDLGEILRGAIEPLMKPLSDAVAALYNNFRADNELTRKTIQTQLEAARWLSFAQVMAA